MSIRPWKHPCQKYIISTDFDQTRFFSKNFSIKELDPFNLRKKTNNGFNPLPGGGQKEKTTVNINLRRLAYYLEVIRKYINQDPYWGQGFEEGKGSELRVAGSWGAFAPRGYLSDGKHSWECTRWMGQRGKRIASPHYPGQTGFLTEVDQNYLFPEDFEIISRPEHRCNGKAFADCPPYVEAGLGRGRPRDHTRIYQSGFDESPKWFCKRRRWLNDNRKSISGCACLEAKMKHGPWSHVDYGYQNDVDSRSRSSQHRFGCAVDISVFQLTHMVQMDPVILFQKVGELIEYACIPNGGMGIYPHGHIHYDFRGWTKDWIPGQQATIDTTLWARWFENAHKATTNYAKNRYDEGTWKRRWEEVKAKVDSFTESEKSSFFGWVMPWEELRTIVSHPNYYKNTPMWKRFVHWSVCRHPVSLEDPEKAGAILKNQVVFSLTRDNYGYGAWDYNDTSEAFPKGTPSSEYYENIEAVVWLSKKKSIKKTINGKTRFLKGLGLKPYKDRDDATLFLLRGRFLGKSGIWKRKIMKIYEESTEIPGTPGKSRNETSAELSKRAIFPLGPLVMDAWLNVMGQSHIGMRFPYNKKHSPHWRIAGSQRVWRDQTYINWRDGLPEAGYEEGSEHDVNNQYQYYPDEDVGDEEEAEEADLSDAEYLSILEKVKKEMPECLEYCPSLVCPPECAKYFPAGFWIF